MNVAVVGASDKSDRYSYKAVKLLQEKGHRVFPVHPRIKAIDGQAVFPTLDAIVDPIDVITLYLAADNSARIADAILRKMPKRIIFNPGAENDELRKLAAEKGIEPIEACTLVLLRTGQF